ncbi:hypothetical protein ACFW6E_45505 [Streptomyces olivaceoviridis]|uniref:hypothetical protein n=1 Tax=Streptomyces olivaceoviridis TaxID=1921 RepID=UPI00368F94B3
MNLPRRPLLLLFPALCALTSCGIPTTGAVEAGRPADGVVPTVRVHFVRDGALVAVPRRTTVPVGVESAVAALLRGPTLSERAKGMTTQLASPTTVPPATDGVSGESGSPDLVRVREIGGRVFIELSPRGGKLNEVAAAQIVCTAVAAQRVASSSAEAAPVTVTDAGHRRFEGSTVRCP